MTDAEDRARSRIVAILLTFVSPLAGMAYLGRWRRGVVYFVLQITVGLIAAASGVFPEATPWSFPVIVITGFAVIDGFRIAGDHLERFEGPWYSRWYGIAGLLILLIVAVEVIRGFLIEPFRIPASSMMPTLQIEDRIVVNKLAYGIRVPFTTEIMVRTGEPQRADIIVFFESRKFRDPICQASAGAARGENRLSGRSFHDQRPVDSYAGVRRLHRHERGTAKRKFR